MCPRSHSLLLPNKFILSAIPGEYPVGLDDPSRVEVCAIICDGIDFAPVAGALLFCMRYPAMKTIATLSPEYSPSWQAATIFDSTAEIRLFPHVKALLDAFAAAEVDYAILPVYNTREGEKKQY